MCVQCKQYDDCSTGFKPRIYTARVIESDWLSSPSKGPTPRKAVPYSELTELYPGHVLRVIPRRKGKVGKKRPVVNSLYAS